MNKLKNSPFVYILAFGAYCACMLFGIFFGSNHPDIFFWSFVIVFVAIIAIYVTPSIKDSIILVGGMLLLAFVGEIVHNLIPVHWNELLKLLIQCLVLSPVYLPLYKHFIKMVVKSEKNNK